MEPSMFCNMCKSTFHSIASKRRHDEKVRVVCEICLKSYCDPSLLRIHTKTVHGTELSVSESRPSSNALSDMNDNILVTESGGRPSTRAPPLLVDAGTQTEKVIIIYDTGGAL